MKLLISIFSLLTLALCVGCGGVATAGSITPDAPISKKPCTKSKVAKGSKPCTKTKAAQASKPCAKSKPEKASKSCCKTSEPVVGKEPCKGSEKSGEQKVAGDKPCTKADQSTADADKKVTKE